MLSEIMITTLIVGIPALFLASMFSAMELGVLASIFVIAFALSVLTFWGCCIAAVWI